MPLSPADLPPELFPYILDYIGTDSSGRNVPRAERLRDVVNCSLVCVDWAKRCRKHLFSGRTLTVKSAAELSVLDFYAYEGSKRLEFIDNLIHTSVCEQDWDHPSWVHQTYQSSLFDVQRRDIVLRGPLPAHLPPSAYRSPHWSLPRSMPSCYLAFFRLTLRDIHFPRLSDLHALIRHFTLTEIILLERITWEKTDLSIPRLGTSKIRGACKRVSATECTDNVLPCLLAFHRLLPSSEWPFSYMGKVEIEAYLDVFNAIVAAGSGDDDAENKRSFAISRGLEPNRHLINEVPRVKVDLTRSLSCEASGLVKLGFAGISLHIQCSSDLAPNKQSSIATSLRVVGIRLHLNCLEDEADAHVVDDQPRHIVQILRTLHSKLPSFQHHLRAVELQAEVDALRRAVAADPEISQLPTLEGNLMYRWGYTPEELAILPPEAEGYASVGVDPTTLELSGQYWNWAGPDRFARTETTSSDASSKPDDLEDPHFFDDFDDEYYFGADIDTREDDSRSDESSGSEVDSDCVSGDSDIGSEYFLNGAE